MESKQLESIAKSVKDMILKLTSIKQELSEDSDDDLSGDAFEFISGAKDNLNDALFILKNKQ